MCFSSQECLFLKHLNKETLNPLFFIKKIFLKLLPTSRIILKPSLNSLSTMSPVVFSALRAAPRIAVLVRALVQDIKYKPIMLNLKQLFPTLKTSLLTFLTPSCVFSNTFLCLHFLPFRFLSPHSSRLYLGESKLEVKRDFFCAEDQNKRVSEAHWEKHIPKQSMDLFHIWKDIFHHMLYVYTSLTSRSLYLPIYSFCRNGSCLSHANISIFFFYLSLYSSILLCC